MDKLSRNLKNYLAKSRLSENELSRRTGVPQQVINRILSGANKNPKIATLMPIANYFMISLSQLIGDTPPPQEIKLNSSHLGWNEIPLIKWNTLNNARMNCIDSKNNKQILVDANVGSNCFAVTLEDNSMEPRFPKGALLIFDNTKKIKTSTFGLFYIHSTNTIVFKQVFIKDKNIYLKSLNQKMAGSKLTLLKSEDEYIAALIQSKLNY